MEKLDTDKKVLKLEKLGIHSKEYKDSENSRTLKQLGIEDDDKLSVTAKMSINALDHLSLMFSDETLTPEAGKMFGEVFSLYTNEEGVMNREGAANFLKLCTNQNTKLDDPRVNRLFDTYNEAKDERLTCDEFKNFYIDSIKGKEQTVWSNIRSWSYKTDLKHGTERPERDRSTLLRYKIPQNEEDFNYILNLLENENYEIAGSAWRFLSELCLNPEVIESILTLEVFNDKENKWLKTSNPFKLIYVLRIIHFFLHYELNSQAEVRVMFKDEDSSNDKDLNVVGSSILRSTGTGVPSPTPAVPVGVAPESNAVSSEGKAHNVVSASANAPPPPPPPPGGPPLPILEGPSEDEKKVQFNEEPEEYNVSVYPPGGEVVEDYPMEVEENIQTDSKTESKEGSSPDKTTSEVKEENYTEQMPLPIIEIAEKYKGQMVAWVSKFIEKGGYDYVCDLYLSEDSIISSKLNNITLMTEEEKACSRLLLEIIGVFNIVAAYVNDETVPKNPEAQKALGEAAEESEFYHVDEDEVMESDPPEKIRTLSSVNKELDEVALIRAKISLYHEINSPNFCNSITPEFAERIIEKFNYEKFVKRTLKTLNEILSTRSLSQMDKDIMNQNMKVTQNLFLYDERSLSILYNFKDEESKTDLKDFIIKGMTFSIDQEIKGIFMNTIWFICQKIMHTEKERLPLMVILEILKDHFFHNIKDSTRYYGYQEFYSGFCNLLREYFKVRKQGNKKFENILDPGIFLRQLVNTLKDYQTKEKRNTVLEDRNLIGMFDIISCILSEMPEFVETFALEHGLLEELWKNCLFCETLDVPNLDFSSQFDQNSVDLRANKCKTKESRAKAFSLLTLLTTNSSKVRESVYSDCLYKMVSCLERPENFSTKSESDARIYFYAGLKNQGATCYMNSMVQQLFMIPAFKYLFLTANDEKDENYESNDIEDEKSLYHNKKIDDNLLHQFQNTLASLELTERPYYNALGLCFSMKDYAGMPTNCSMQQDSQEFLNLCFDRLEHLLKPTPQKHIIQDIFSAKQCTHMTCDSCDYVKSRIEEYYILSVPVKGFKSLEESFNSYTDGEIISDFRCDNCEQKVDIKKNCSLVDMPNILMIHLQKIHFNVETLMNEKIGDKYEFPTHLDMNKYTINNIAEKHGIKDPDLHKYEENNTRNFEYRLVGVIIHQGVADGGHYYSLICTDSQMKDQKKEWLSTEGMKWTEFNDTETKDYNFRSNFHDDCFGGKNNSFGPALPSEFQSWGGAGASSKSAYVLIYEKREFNDIKV